MRAPPAGSPPARLTFLALGAALLLGAGGSSRLPAAPNELGHPIVRDFPPGRSKIGHLCQAVAQDADGFVYIGNGVFVFCYDGDSWLPIKVPTACAGIRKFAVTATGTVYAGGAGIIGYFQANGSNREFVSLAGKLPPTEIGANDIYDVLAVGNTVCFADEEKILIWRDRQFTVVPCRAPPHSHGARLHRVGETVYVSALGAALRRLVDDHLQVVVENPLFRENQIITIEAGADGALNLLTAERGFFQLTAGGVQPLSTDANGWLAGRSVLRAQRLGDGSLAVLFTSTTGNGGMRFATNGGYLGPIDNSIGLYAKTLRDLACDQEGGLWMGCETGLFRIEWPSAVTVFDRINGLGAGAVADVVRHDGTVYAATTEGVYRLDPSDVAGRCARFERMLNVPAYSLLSHPAGLLALGYADLLVQSPTGFTAVAKLPPGGGTLHRSTHDPDRIWIGTTKGIHSVRHSAQGWQDEGHVPGFDHGAQENVEAPDGSLWIATPDQGLVRIDFSGERSNSPGVPRIERFAGVRGLPNLGQRISVADWFGEPAVMIKSKARPMRFDSGEGRFAPVPGTESLPEELAETGWSAISEATGTRDALWLASAKEILQVSRGGVAPRQLPHLAIATTGAVTRLREEYIQDEAVLWICGANGLARVDVARAFPPSTPFFPLLTPTGISEGAQLRPGHEPVTFRYIAPRHQIANSVRYQTRLAGHDAEWSAWSTGREQTFSHLPAGNFRFEVRARDADGRMSTTAHVGFSVLPPWWLTTGAILGYVVTGGSLVAGIVRLRTRRLQHRAAHLEGVIAERTSELAQKNLELIRLNRLEFDEKTAARLAEEKARLEVLRYQLNPHFLFNTLASISASLPGGSSTARTMVERLADFCRLTLHRSDERDWTTLGEEMQLLRAYLGIEQTRWGDLLDVTIAGDPALDEDRLPHFLLLPLVENALKYGRATSAERVGFRLTLRREADGSLVFDVSNTGEWVEPTAKRTVSSLGIGLENLRERLTRYYPGQHELSFSHGNGWVTVTLRLALRREA